MIRLYGHDQGGGSFATVTRGLREALSDLGLLSGYMAVDAGYLDDETISDAPVSLNVGSPKGVWHAHRHGAHRSRWLMLAPNGERMPPGLMEMLTTPSAMNTLPLQGFLTPSAWGRSVLLGHTMPSTVLPIIVCPHGVGREFRPRDVEHQRAEEYRDGVFRVLHMSSGETERKGTMELLKAWALWRTAAAAPRMPMAAQLTVTVTLSEMGRVLDRIGDLDLAGSVRVRPGFAGPVDYTDYHLVCQPSRAEGFGLTPLEARASGVPVAATVVTGHTEGHLEGPGVVRIPYYPSGPMDDFPFSTAPVVDPAAICQSLVEAFSDWPMLYREAQDHAEVISELWAWPRVTEVPIREMLEMSQ